MPSAAPAALSPGQVSRRFRRLLDEGMTLCPAGLAKRRPARLLEAGYVPRALVELFDTRFFLCHPRQNDDIRFFVAYVVQATGARGALRAFPRIFYKDVSLVWRSASHFVRSATENWIGKGDLTAVRIDGEEMLASAEETTDLPLEIQSALEALLRRARRIRRDDDAVALILRRGGDDRIQSFPDFTWPRLRAQSDPRNRVHGGRRVARFARRDDPRSLRFARGYEPDFRHGLLETSRSHSRLYGGALVRHRILSRNRRIQYLFMAGPEQVWIVPPQATTTELSSYGVRTIDVAVDEDLCVPGYEYHFLDDSVEPPEWVSQIPEGFAGPASPLDPSRCSASPWIDAMPVVRDYRRTLLRRGRTTAR